MAKFTLEFGPKSTERLEQIATSQETSRADVVRRALEVYDELLSRKEQGGHILVTSSDGKEREVLI